MIYNITSTEMNISSINMDSTNIVRKLINILKCKYKYS